MKYTLLAIFAALIFGVFPGRPAWANEAGAAAQLSMHSVAIDSRVQQLTDYLASHNSPLTGSARHFVNEADRLGLDWKLVVAIAGVESTFGRHIPTGSFNAWGWAVFTGRQFGAAFENWEKGITTVSEGLRYNYIDKGAVTIEQIGRIYAASPVWSQKVRFFLAKIEQFAPTRSGQLDITI